MRTDQGHRYSRCIQGIAESWNVVYNKRLKIKLVSVTVLKLVRTKTLQLRTNMLCNQQTQRNLFYRSASTTLTWNSSKYSYSKNPHCKVFVRRETRERYRQESSVVRPSCRHTERTRTVFYAQKYNSITLTV